MPAELSPGHILSSLASSGNTLLDNAVHYFPFPQDAIVLAERNPSPYTIVTDVRTYQYHGEIVRDIAAIASKGHINLSKIDYFGDKTWRSTLPEVTLFRAVGIKKAVVVGFVTGPMDAPEGTKTEIATATMAERTAWFQANINSLLHHTPPWVREVCLTIPYFEARSDRDAIDGEAALAEIFADAIAGAKRRPKYIVTLEDHSHRLDKYLPEGHVAVTANQELAEALVEAGWRSQNMIVASPDIGAIGRADDFAMKLAKLLGIKNVDLTILDKKRNLYAVNQSILGEFIREVDVQGKDVVIRDDLGDGWGTSMNAAKKLKEKGAKRIAIVITHAVDSGKARERIEEALQEGIADEIFITDSKPLTWEKETPGIHIVKIGKLLGEISTSLLENGLNETRRRFGQHLFQPKHPLGMLEAVKRRRNHLLWKPIFQAK